uniref:lytic transglycosylase domain-containing protein n=1 Tax=Phenylobacterium sp. TaxID=1871053 RepID=UPI00286B0BA1
AAIAAIASPCLADVIEIAPDGAAVTYAAPAVFGPDGASPINVRTAAAGPAIDISKVITEAARRQQLSADLVTEVAWRESRFHQQAVSNRDAVGVMQLTAATARDLGVNRYDLSENIHGGAAYLRQMMDRYGGDVRLALAAYNAGPGAVDRYRGVPPFQETTAYVATILSRIAQKTLVGGLAPVTGR